MNHEVEEIRKLLKIYQDLDKLVFSKKKIEENRLELLAKHVKAKIGLHNYNFTYYLSRTEDVVWNPVYRISNIQYRGKYFFKIDTEWYSSSESPTCKVYSHKIEKVSDFLLAANIEQFKEELEKQSGLPVEYLNYEVVKSVATPKNVDDIRFLHPKCKILLSDKKYYEGWDIGDPYVIAKTEEGLHIYYATDGHGGGMANHIKPGEDYSNFISFLGYKPECLNA